MSLAQKGRRVVLAGLVLLGGVYVRALAFTPVERFQGAAPSTAAGRNSGTSLPPEVTAMPLGRTPA